MRSPSERASSSAEAPSGVLLVDKPRGPTSHDVVAIVRRALHTRAVGHAGTLDPMATGLLVVLVGDATRLATWVSGSSKRYRAVVSLGRATDTLDAEGRTTEEAPLPDEVRLGLGPAIEAALDVERARAEQVPPAVSAIHVAGERAHVLARRGEAPTLAPRATRARAIDLLRSGLVDGGAELEVELACDKGYYVRSFARDVGATLGVPAHLSELRRLSSGALDVGEAVALVPDALPAALVPLARILPRLLPCVALTEHGALRARQGKALDGASHFETASPAGVCAWLYEGAPIAIGELVDGVARVVRGFPTRLRFTGPRSSRRCRAREGARRAARRMPRRRRPEARRPRS